MRETTVASTIVSMCASCHLPVILPKIRGQHWSCHSCGYCCRSLVVHLTAEDRKRIDELAWDKMLGVRPYVRVGRGWALNKQSDGACVFLDDDNRCRIHAEHGERNKPLACRIFPFSVRPTREGWQSSLRFDCPSVTTSHGEPIDQHRRWLTELASELGHVAGDDGVDLQYGVRATPDEIDAVTRRFTGWMHDGALPLANRLVGAARVTSALAEAKLYNVRGARFAELIDLLFGAQRGDSPEVPAGPTAKQRGMLRQLAFAHAEHATLADMQSGLIGRIAMRWRQLRSAKAFLKGEGSVPAVIGLPTGGTFDAVESATPAVAGSGKVGDLLLRYLASRLESKSSFGRGYFGWSVVNGLGALLLSVAVAGWWARRIAIADERGAINIEDVGRSLAVVDRAATRLPALGAIPERARIRYLLQDDGIARLIRAYALCGDP